MKEASLCWRLINIFIPWGLMRKIAFVLCAAMIVSTAQAETAPAAVVGGATTSTTTAAAGALVDVAEDGAKSAAHSAITDGAKAVGADAGILGSVGAIAGQQADGAVADAANSARNELGVAVKNAPVAEQVAEKAAQPQG